MQLLPRRALISLGLALSFVVSAVAPAHASYTPNNSLRAGQRPRAGASTWAARSVDFASGWDATNHNAWMTFGFEWHQDEHKMDLTGSQQFIEFNAEVPCSWARVAYTNGTTAGDEGYEPYGFDTDLPLASLPFEDSTFGEACISNSYSGRGKFGAGVLNASAIPSGHHFIRITLADASFTSTPSNGAVRITVGTGTSFDADQGAGEPQQLQSDCTFSDSDISDWDNTTWDALNRRLQASWCAWQDPDHTLVQDYPGVLQTGHIDGFGSPEAQTFYADALANQGMESAGSYTVVGSASRYCNDWTGAFDGVCFYQMVGANSGIYQSVSDAALARTANAAGTYNLSMEVALRCRAPQDQGCGVALELIGQGSGAQSEAVWTESLPGASSGQWPWYICRLDYDHGGGQLGGNPNAVHWKIRNLYSDYVDIDYGFIGGKSERTDPSPDGHPQGVGEISAGNICTQRAA